MPAAEVAVELYVGRQVTIIMQMLNSKDAFLEVRFVVTQAFLGKRMVKPASDDPVGLTVKEMGKLRADYVRNRTVYLGLSPHFMLEMVLRRKLHAALAGESHALSDLPGTALANLSPEIRRCMETNVQRLNTLLTLIVERKVAGEGGNDEPQLAETACLPFAWCPPENVILEVPATNDHGGDPKTMTMKGLRGFFLRQSEDGLSDDDRPPRVVIFGGDDGDGNCPYYIVYLAKKKPSEFPLLAHFEPVMVELMAEELEDEVVKVTPWKLTARPTTEAELKLRVNAGGEEREEDDEYDGIVLFDSDAGEDGDDDLLLAVKEEPSQEQLFDDSLISVNSQHEDEEEVGMVASELAISMASGLTIAASNSHAQRASEEEQQAQPRPQPQSDQFNLLQSLQSLMSVFDARK